MNKVIFIYLALNVLMERCDPIKKNQDVTIYVENDLNFF